MLPRPRYTWILVIIACLMEVACRSRTGNAGTGDRLSRALGDTIFQPKDSGRATHFVDSVYLALPGKTINDARERYFLLAHIAYGTARNYHKALLYSDSLMKLTGNDYIDSDAYLEAILQRGDILSELMRYDEAFTLFYRAKELVAKKKDPCLLPGYTIRLANVSNRQKRYKEGAEFFKQILRELDACPDTSFTRFTEIQGHLDNVGVMYNRINWLDSADLYYRKAVDYIAANAHRFPDRSDFIGVARAVVYGNQGDIAARRGDLVKAKTLLKASIDFNKYYWRAPEDAAYNMIKLGNIYLQEGNPDSVLPLLVQVDTIRKSFPNDELTSKYLYLVSQYHAAKGNILQAHGYLAERTRLYDSAILPAISNPTISVGDALEQVSRQYQLENDNRRKNDYLVVGAFGFAMLLVILILLWYTYQRSRRSISKLNLLNKNISEKNAALLDTLEKLEQMRRDKRQLMHIVAHDLRSPVGSMTTLARMIRQGQIDKESMDEVLDMLIKAGTSAQALIGQLLEERARETQGKHEAVNVEEVLKSAADILEYRAAEKQQSIRLHTCHAQLVSDRDKLQRIVHNLLDNAIKFSPNGAEIRIDMEIAGNKLLIRIADHGIGIPEHMRAGLLDEIAAVRRTGTYGEPSYGLGLSIVSQLVRETGGTISFTSVENDGTVFCIEYELPQNS